MTNFRDVSQYPAHLRRLAEELFAHEDYLSDGYQYYCGEDELVIKDILQSLYETAGAARLEAENERLREACRVGLERLIEYARDDADCLEGCYYNPHEAIAPTVAKLRAALGESEPEP